MVVASYTDVLWVSKHVPLFKKSFKKIQAKKALSQIVLVRLFRAFTTPFMVWFFMR